MRHLHDERCLCDITAENNGYSRIKNNHTGSHLYEHQRGGRKTTETFVTEFCYIRVNFSLEELKNIKIVLFLIHELFKYPNSQKSHFFNQHDSSLYVNATPRKGLEIQA